MVYSEYVMAPYSRQAAMYERSQKKLQKAAGAVEETKKEAQSFPKNKRLKQGRASSNVNSNRLEGAEWGPAKAPKPAQLRSAPKTVIEDSLTKVVINSLGARIESYKLKAYKETLGKEKSYDMISWNEGAPYPGGVISGGVSDADVSYNLVAVRGLKEAGKIYRPESDTFSVSYEGILGDGRKVRKIYKFSRNSYLFEVNIKLSAPPEDGSRLWFEWDYFDHTMGKYSRFSPKALFFMSLLDKKVTTTFPSKIEDGVPVAGHNEWISIGNKYFTAITIPQADGVNSKIIKSGKLYRTLAAGAPEYGQFLVYVGPKEYKTLQRLGHNLYQSVDLGFFAALAHPLLGLIRIFYSFFGNYGLSIILLTLLIKALFLPLTKKSFKSMNAMQKLQPKIQKLREQYKNDPNRMNQELIALYKKEGVNPMGGCLPMLIQLPVFLGLYNALLNSIELRHAPFALWILDLSAPERLYIGGVGIPVMVVIMGISMFVQQWMTPSAMDPTQKKIMMFMPVMFTFLFLKFPAGLVLYWLTNNIVSIVQQYYIRKERHADATKATVIGGVAIFGFAYILTLL
ncbi:MAG: membrane protein insertase YidC [Candidatus Dadabacteria bacterium]|nr:MAG: membrane protein insertase YidC [Candidatus Dadabacteria bacterium]